MTYKLAAIVFSCLLLCAPSALGETRLCPLRKVIDGDTLKIEYGGRTENVRLIGIDTAEISENPKLLRDSGRTGRTPGEILRAGARARSYLVSVIGDARAVRLEFDVQRRDRHGRLLAYVYLPEGPMLNELLLRDGYASLMTIPPNVRYVERFKSALREARKGKDGLWAPSAPAR